MSTLHGTRLSVCVLARVDNASRCILKPIQMPLEEQMLFMQLTPIFHYPSLHILCFLNTSTLLTS
jgi:hypothetical protein